MPLVKMLIFFIAVVPLEIYYFFDSNYATYIFFIAVTPLEKKNIIALMPL